MIFEKLSDIISEKMDIDLSLISMDSTFESLQLDSLDMVEIIMEIEDEFGVSIESAEGLKTVSDLVKHIEANQ